MVGFVTDALSHLCTNNLKAGDTVLPRGSLSRGIGAANFLLGSYVSQLHNVLDTVTCTALKLEKKLELEDCY
jgi:hypothetical protein